MKKILNDKFIGKLIKSFIEGFIASLIVVLQDINNFKSMKTNDIVDTMHSEPEYVNTKMYDVMEYAN